MRIDPHVHFRDEEQNYKETIKHGLQTAKEQGVEYVFDMPNTAKPIITEEDVKRRLKYVPESEKKRYFLYIGATSNPEQLQEAIRLVRDYREVIGIKMFAGKSTGDLQIIDEDEQKKVYQTLTENNYMGVLAVHCEKESSMKNLFDPINPHTHCLARPKQAEIESVKDQIRFAKETSFTGTLQICHVSCKETVDLVQEARKKIKITCAATPHHLMWNEKMMRRADGLLYKMNPPLRSEEDVEALRECLRKGLIDWIETDHAPHTIGEKMHNGHPSGYPSLYLYKECVEKLLPILGLDKKQIEELTYNNIIKTFDLKL